MRDNAIVVTRADAARLRDLLSSRAQFERDQDHLQELAGELERARIVEESEVPPDVLTMHRPVSLLDLATGTRRELTLVLPRDADPGAGRISVLAPLGTALLGYRAGDEIEWRMPGGLRRLRIEAVRQAEQGNHATGEVATAVAG